MKFITEDDLRDLYKKEPFISYEPEPETRLTPGARQFLADRGINMFDDESFINRCASTSEEEARNQSGMDWRQRELRNRFKSAEALSLVIGGELLESDVLMAQNVIAFGKQLAEIRRFAEGVCSGETAAYEPCSGMDPGDLKKDMGDCFEITEFHLQLAKGKEILKLHRLRCAIREIEPAAMELCESSKKEVKLYNDVIGKVNAVINGLSQEICSAVGGKECQRKN